MTTRKKIDSLIDDAAFEDYEGMTKVERDRFINETTLAGLRILGKSIDELDRRLDEIVDQLNDLAVPKNDDVALDVIVGGLTFLRKKVKKMAKKK